MGHHASDTRPLHVLTGHLYRYVIVASDQRAFSPEAVDQPGLSVLWLLPRGLLCGCVYFTETKGWPLLTVETVAIGDSKSTNERGPYLFGSSGLPSFEIFVLPWQLLSAHCKIFFFSPYTLSFHLSPPPPRTRCRQSCWVVCLSVCVSGLCIE